MVLNVFKLCMCERRWLEKITQSIKTKDVWKKTTDNGRMSKKKRKDKNRRENEEDKSTHTCKRAHANGHILQIKNECRSSATTHFYILCILESLQTKAIGRLECRAAAMLC